MIGGAGVEPRVGVGRGVGLLVGGSDDLFDLCIWDGSTDGLDMMWDILTSKCWHWYCTNALDERARLM